MWKSTRETFQVWIDCYNEEMMRRMKDLHLENLIARNSESVVDIEECDTVRHYRSRQRVEEEEERCTNEEISQSQKQFQNCSHDIKTR